MQATSGDDAVKMGMEQQFLRPAVQHAREADLGAEILRVFRHVVQRLRDGGKEQTVGQPWIRTKEGMESIGDGEDDVVVLDRQQMLLLCGEPAKLLKSLTLRAVPISTRIVGDLPMPAPVTLVKVTAEGRGATTQDVSHHTRLLTVESRKLICELTKDVGKLQLGSTPTAVRRRRAVHGSGLDGVG
jgi:hypothetical protein